MKKDSLIPKSYSVVKKIPCKCGEGHFRIEFTADEGLSTDTYCTQHEDAFGCHLSIECETCDWDYYLDKHGENIVIAEREDVYEYITIDGEAWDRETTLLKTHDVKKVLADFVSLIERRGSVGAIYQFLLSSRLEDVYFETFREDWKGAQSWVNGHFRFSDLPRIMELVGNTNYKILNEVRKIERLNDQARNLPPVTWETIWTISPTQLKG